MNALFKRACRQGAAALLSGAVLLGCAPMPRQAAPAGVKTRHLDETVRQAMDATGARGLAVAVVDEGRLMFSKAYGVRNAAGDPLREDTVMHGASLTKPAFACLNRPGWPAQFASGGARPPHQVLKAFVDQHRQQHGVESICRVQQIAPSAYWLHAGCQRSPALRSLRARREASLI